MTARDGLEPGLERLDLERRLVVDTAWSDSPKSGISAPEAAHEALRPDDAEVDARDADDGVDEARRCPRLRARRRPRPRARRGSRDCRAPHTRGGTRHGRRPRALSPARLAVRGEVAREENDVGPSLERRERSHDAAPKRLRTVDVAGRGQPKRCRHARRIPAVRDCQRPQRVPASGGPFSRRDVPWVDRHHEARCGGAARCRGPGDARRRPRSVGARPTHRARRRLLPPRGGCRTRPGRARRGGHARGSPARGWLFKAHNDEVVVDLIFRPSGGPIADDHFGRAEQLEVMAQPMLVASLDDVLVTKLLSREQARDFGPVLELSRSLREQVDWDVVRARTSGSPFARAFFTLVEARGSRRRSLRLRGPLQGCRTKPVEPPTVRQPQYVPPKHDLHRHAVLLPHGARSACGS